MIKNLVRCVSVVCLLLCSSQLLAKEGEQRNPLPPIPSDRPLLQIRGSSTLGEQLTPRLVSALLDSKGFRNIQQQSTGNHEMRITASSPDGQPVWVLISSHGSSTGFSSMQRGNADLVMSSRPIRSSEVASLLAQGDMLSAEAEYIVGLDGIAVVVNPDNPLKELSIEQLARVFSGEVREWEQLGGTGGAIHRYIRDEDSGTRASFNDLVLRPFGMRMAADSRVEDSASSIAARVLDDPQGIGFVDLADIGQARALAVSLPGTHAMQPLAQNVASEDYPLSRRLYFYRSPTRSNDWAEELARFAVSPQGQQLVSASGLVAQVVQPMQMDAERLMPPAYSKLVHKSRRLTTTLRFRDSQLLDSKSELDMQRLISFLRQQGGNVQRLVLVGFNERSDSYPRSVALSRMRASIVQRALASQGIFVSEVVALGHSLPVADNDTQHGRLKNRRVEVWIN